MIKKLLTIAALALPLMAANAQESVEKVVFEEDFSLMTKLAHRLTILSAKTAL